jgi:hypothetical protein
MTVFKGFHAPRFQQHDDHIRQLVLEFNSNKAKRCGCNAAQVAKIATLDEDLVKAWAIQESGGFDARSLAAWRVDPLQVNVPGDWNEFKSDLGIKMPAARNEGNIRQNLMAGIILLCRKGFGKSGQPPANNPSGVFDGWKVALRRYNGRTEVRSNGKNYSENYAVAIWQRSQTPSSCVPSELA